MRLIRYRIVRRYAPGLNVFVIQRSIFWMSWQDVRIKENWYYMTMDKAFEHIPDYYKELPDFKIDMKVWPLKHYVNTEQ